MITSTERANYMKSTYIYGEARLWWHVNEIRRPLGIQERFLNNPKEYPRYPGKSGCYYN